MLDPPTNWLVTNAEVNAGLVANSPAVPGGFSRNDCSWVLVDPFVRSDLFQATLKLTAVESSKTVVPRLPRSRYKPEDTFPLSDSIKVASVSVLRAVIRSAPVVEAASSCHREDSLSSMVSKRSA